MRLLVNFLENINLLICILLFGPSLCSVNYQYEQLQSQQLKPKVLDRLNLKIGNFNVIYRTYLETSSLSELYLILEETSVKFLGPTFYEDDPVVEFQMNVIEKFRMIGQNEGLSKLQLEELLNSNDLRALFTYVYIMEVFSHEEIISIFKSSLLLQPLWLQKSIKHFERKINCRIGKEREEIPLMIDIIQKLNKLAKDPKVAEKIGFWKQELKKETKNHPINDELEVVAPLEKVQENKSTTLFNEEPSGETGVPSLTISEVSKVKNLRRRRKGKIERVEEGVFTRFLFYIVGMVLAIGYNLYRWVRH